VRPRARLARRRGSSCSTHQWTQAITDSIRDNRLDVTRGEGNAPRVRAPQDLLAGLALLALALLAFWASRALPTGRLGAPGPGFLPRVMAAGLGLTGMALAVLSFLRAGEALGRFTLRGPLLVLLAVAGFALTIRVPGLLVAGPLVVVVGGAASPESRPRELVIFALIITLACAGLFRYALHLPIPVLVIPGLVTL
jgi:putative tricarboxylic transport membrane protein